MIYLFQHRRLIRTFFACLMMLAVAAVLSRPRLIATFSADSTNTSFATEVTPATLDASAWNLRGQTLVSDGTMGWSIGGFPLDSMHWTHGSVGPDDTDIERRMIDPIPMALNLAVLTWVAWVLTSLCWQIERGQSMLDWIRSRSGRSRMIAIGSALFLVMGIVGYAVDRNKVAIAWRSKAEIQTVCSLSRSVFRRLPAGWTACWRHVYAVNLRDEDATLRRLPPTTQVLSVLGEINDSASIEISKLGLLHTFGWTDADGDGDLKTLTERCPNLLSLRVTFQRDRLHELRELSPLRSLRRLHLSGATSSAWGDTLRGLTNLRSLRLELPLSQASKVELRGLVDLDRLSIGIARGETRVASAWSKERPRLRLQIGEMPRLQKLLVDPRFHLDLDLRRVSSLTTVAASFGENDLWRPSHEAVMPLVNRLKIDGAERLGELSFRTWDLQSLHASGVPLLEKVTIGPTWESSTSDHAASDHAGWGHGHRERRRGRSGWMEAYGLLDHALDGEESQTVVRWLRSVPSVTRLSLSSVDLRGIDLEGLSDCRKLAELRMQDCLVAPHQLAKLKHSPSLRRLSLDRTEVTQSTAETLLAMHNDWIELRLNWHDFPQLRIVDQPRLSLALTGAPISATDVELVNLPQLTQPLIFSQPTQRLVISNLPNVSQLQIWRSPRSMKIEAIGGLRQLLIRGGSIDEALLTEIARATSMTSLHLIDCDVPDSLAGRINGFKELTELNLTRTPVQSLDSVKWSDNTYLRRIVLDHTDPSPQVIENLAACDRLQLISLLGCDVSTESLEPLVHLMTLYELCVDNAEQLPEALLAAHCRRGTLSIDIQ